MSFRTWAAACLLLTMNGCKSQSLPPSTESPRVLVFTKTAGFRHDSIPAGVRAIQQLSVQDKFHVDCTEDSNAFSSSNLARYRAVVFLNTSGDVLSPAQETAFQKFIENGGGFVGVHAAADTEHEWPWYGQLVGARFKSHPQIQAAEVVVHDRHHISTRHLPYRWSRTDEWYNFDQHPGERIGKTFNLLASLDESTYSGGDMNGDHPMAWCHQIGQGRSWYTAGGHTIESYSEPAFVEHLRGGIKWVLQRGQ